MPPRMSCSLTVAQVLDGSKTVTRRAAHTWSRLKVGDHLVLIEKGMGLRRGQRQRVLRTVEVTSVTVVPLWPISWTEIKREGLWGRARRVLEDLRSEDTPSQWFCRFWLKSHGYDERTDPSEVQVRRIEWRYIDGGP